jgi:hypothetical protein
MRKEILILGALIFALFAVGLTSAANATVCCDQTTSGLYCQDVPQSECANGAQAVPSACASVSYCKGGWCYDSQEGTCLDNTPQMVCNANNGTWSEEKPAQCELGCCVLGDQASFVSLVRCKRLASFLGLQTNFKKNIKDEVSCVMSVKNQERGACVYTSDFEKTCKFTTRGECGTNGVGALKGEFFVGKLCTSEELGTNCGMTSDTMCVPGKDEIYFKDSCGNPANIYDAAKIKDKKYWATIVDKTQSCNPNGNSANSATCGNCNYLQGSICRATTKGGAKATYGTNVCMDLNCKNTQNGKSYKHGESWCVYNDNKAGGKTGEGRDAVGSRFYKHICINGQEVLEQCADFRQEECIQDSISTTAGDFSQAGCRVNRWQDCVAQTTRLDCENTDRRDCLWKPGIQLNNESDEEATCLPMNPPGLKFWEGEEAKAVCSQVNTVCIVKYEKGLFGGEKCVDNCECLEEDWLEARNQVCMNLGDCGPNVNWIGASGYKPGYNLSVEKYKPKEKEDDD